MKSVHLAAWPLLVVGLAVTVILLGITASGTDAARANVSVNPGPTSKNASIWSEISFRGIRAGRGGPMTVRGSRSGRHGHARRPHSDKRGFSLLLKRPLRANETVTVKTRLRINGAKGGTYRFRTENIHLPRAGRKAQTKRPSTGQPGYRTRPNLTPPVMKIAKTSKSVSNRSVFIGSKDAGNTIYRANGEPIWYRPGRTMDFRVQKYRGRNVLTWFEAPTKGSGLKKNTYMMANQAYKIIRRVTPGNGYSADAHEFRLTKRNTAYVTSYRVRLRDLRKFGMSKRGRVSDSIAQEVDLKTGRVIWEWHSLDHVPVSHTYAEHPRRPGNPFDYFHINAVTDTPDGNVMITGRSTNTVYKVSRKTGRVIWRLGGKKSTYKLGKGAVFSWQHDAQPLPGNRVSIYDNSDSPVVSKPWRKQSRGLILKLNNKKKKATVQHQFYHPDKPLASTQGNLQTQSNGNYLVGWGSVPLMSEYGPKGNLIFNARFLGISSFYRAYRKPWRGNPGSRASLVAARTGNPGQTRIWVSRNGDTVTRKWQVLAGNSKKSLKPVATRNRDGFETVTAAPTAATWIRVRGRDAKGKVTGYSRKVKARK